MLPASGQTWSSKLTSVSTITWVGCTTIILADVVTNIEAQNQQRQKIHQEQLKVVEKMPKLRWEDIVDTGDEPQ